MQVKLQEKSGLSEKYATFRFVVNSNYSHILFSFLFL